MARSHHDVHEEYKKLRFRFRVNNTLELSNGRCACISCQKLFRSSEYLNTHFEKHHALELQKLKQEAEKIASQKGDSYHLHTHRDHTYNSTYQDKSGDSLETLTTFERVEMQTRKDYEEKMTD